MWDILWISLFLLGFIIIFIIISIEYLNFKINLEYSFTQEYRKRHFFSFPEFWSIILSLLTSIMFFMLAPAQLEIEIPYQFYNSTGNFTILGAQTFTSKTSPEIFQFCELIAVVMFIFFMFRVFMTFRGLYEKRKGLDD